MSLLRRPNIRSSTTTLERIVGREKRCQLKVNLPKSKAINVVQIGQRNLIDAEAMGALLGFTAQYVNRIAAAGKIPWHGVRNGAKVYRRFDALEVLGALKHGLDASDSTK